MLASDTEAYAGHLGKARELTKRSVDSAIRADSKENGAIWLENAALRRSCFRQLAEARQAAAEALKLAPDESGSRGRSCACLCHGGRYGTSRILGTRPEQTLSAGHPDAVSLAACDSRTTGAGSERIRLGPECLQAASPIELGQIPFVNNISCLYPDVHSRRSIPGSRTGQCSRRRVSENSRPQRHRLELLDGSVGASGSGSCERLASENLARSGCRCRPRSGLAAYKDFLTLWKDADPDIPILKASQGRVREVAVAGKFSLVAARRLADVTKNSQHFIANPAGQEVGGRPRPVAGTAPAEVQRLARRTFRQLAQLTRFHTGNLLETILRRTAATAFESAWELVGSSVRLFRWRLRSGVRVAFRNLKECRSGLRFA